MDANQPPKRRRLNGQSTSHEDPETQSENDQPGGSINKFACPYVKRFPRSQLISPTCAHEFPKISRLKEHLYRCHRSEYQCERCHEKFEDKVSLDGHHQAWRGCERGTQLDPRLFTSSTLVELKKKSDAKKSEEGKWIDVYTILFGAMPESSIPSPHHGDASYRSLYSPEQLTSMIKFKLRESYVPPEFDNAIIGVMFGCVEDLLHQRQQGPHNFSFSDEYGQPTPPAATFSASLPTRRIQEQTAEPKSRTGTLTEPGDETAQLADANQTPGPWSKVENDQYYGQICEDIPHMIQPELQPGHADYDWLPQQGEPSHPSFYAWSHPDVEIQPTAPHTVPEGHTSDPYQDATVHDPASDASGCHGYGLEQYGQGYYQ